MARYWVYLDDNVAGPYGLEQLIRIRGFSRQTMVCIDDASGKPTNWISPAEIPELAHIFKAVDEHLANTPASPSRKAASKPVVPRPHKPYTPAVTLRAPSRNTASVWAWTLLAACVLSGAIFAGMRYMHKGDEAREQNAAQSLIENAHLPSPSPYSTLRQYIEEKQVKARWEFQRMQEALYDVTLSWYGPSLVVYAFEVNIQAQTVRGLNTAAAKLLSEGFPAPPSAAPKAAPVPKKSPAELFTPTINSRRDALENGDFNTVWDLFSQRKKGEMAKGGISREGFLRLQGLTHRVDAVIKQTVLKTKQESDTDRLVLIKQSQAGQPDIFIKQLWLFENGSWKLDDEEKRSTESVQRPASEVPSPELKQAAPTPSSTSDVGPRTPDPKASPASLPGMSH